MKTPYKVDPRAKLFIVLCLSTIGVLIRDMYVLLIVLLLAVMSAELFRCDFKKLYYKLRHMLKIILVIAIVQSIFTSEGTTIIKVYSIDILTTGGIIRAVKFILRVAIVIISASIVTTSSYRKIVQSLVQMKIPYEIAFMVSVGIRFLPIMIEEFNDAIIAIQLRGIDLDKIPLKSKFKIYAYIFTPVIAGSMMKAKKLSIVMETKAFRAYPQRVSYNVLTLRKLDYFIMIISSLISLAIVGWYLLFLSK